ncbi:MAG: hypothetical protein K1000chlam3_00244 [Chlamydiae bacterium]|nr:hypothetical protein [Chlamydiota bacterium]
MNIKEFIKKAYEHRISLSRKKFALGILLMLSGWQLIAFCISVHDLSEKSGLGLTVDYSFQMLISTCFLIILAIFLGLFTGNGMRGYQTLKITRENEVLFGGTSSHLSYWWRVGAIYLRAFVATFGYFLFEIAGSKVNIIDNSVLHGADALAFALLYGWWIGKKKARGRVYDTWQWAGMIISFFAVILAVLYEVHSGNYISSIEGVLSGFVSSIALATVILLSSIVLYHDSVIRVAFHNCLFGFVVMGLLGTFYLISAINSEGFSSIRDTLHSINFVASGIIGLAYPIALLCFFQAYKYIEPVFISMLGNSLGLGTIAFSFLIVKKTLDMKDMYIAILLVVGSLILGIREWRKGIDE